MIEHIARFPRVRDRAIFVGDADDIVPDDFGAGLPGSAVGRGALRLRRLRARARRGAPADRAALRAELGYGADERVCLVTVGGSGVGGALLARVIDALPDARRRVPGLRMVAVAGPRIDPDVAAAPDGLEVRGYVHELYRHLAACDVAVVQGGLTTTMELAAAQRAVRLLPARSSHFEQNLHVRHRLDRYGAAGCSTSTTPARDDRGRDRRGARRAPQPADVERDGAARAAALIAPLL